MTTDEEFEEFVKNNREAIEKMIESQKEIAKNLVDAEKEAAEYAFRQARDLAGYGREKTEELVKAAFETMTDPEIQKHFFNMGMEFMLGISAIVRKAPVPDFVKSGFDATESSMRNAGCRANTDCAAKKAPQKIGVLEAPSGDGE